MMASLIDSRRRRAALTAASYARSDSSTSWAMVFSRALDGIEISTAPRFLADKEASVWLDTSWDSIAERPWTDVR